MPPCVGFYCGKNYLVTIFSSPNSMATDDVREARFQAWLAALDERHLADLTASEVARALRALSSCYVERRSRLAGGKALEGAGKRAAFALFYAPVHFLIVRHIVVGLGLQHRRIASLQDLGCGTGAAGAAWAFEAPGARISGIDRHPWAVAEANWTYRRLAVDGRAAPGDAARVRLESGPQAAIVAAYTVNELPDDARFDLRDRLLRSHRGGAAVLVIEPIARRLTPWWSEWESAFVGAGGRADEWRFPVVLPDRQRQLAKAAGLRPTELTGRSLLLAAM